MAIIKWNFEIKVPNQDVEEFEEYFLEWLYGGDDTVLKQNHAVKYEIEEEENENE